MKPFLIVLLVFVTQVAFAHPGHNHGDLNGGFWHPLMGLDHLLVALGIGLWAAQVKGRSLYALPISFLAFMILGASIGQLGHALPLAEASTIVSVVFIGLAVVFGASLPLLMSVPVVGSFALFHGNLHALEATSVQGVLPYFAGLLLSTALIHLVGISVSLGLARLCNKQGDVLSVRRCTDL